jgi:hypothetical protein
MLMIIVVSNDSYRLTCTFCALCPRGKSSIKNLLYKSATPQVFNSNTTAGYIIFLFFHCGNWVQPDYFIHRVKRNKQSHSNHRQSLVDENGGIG